MTESPRPRSQVLQTVRNALPSGVNALAVSKFAALLGLALTGCHKKEATPSAPVAPVDPLQSMSEEEKAWSHSDWNYELNSDNLVRISVNPNEKTLYAWIKENGHAEEENEEDMTYYSNKPLEQNEGLINAEIHFARALNPGFNLDDFDSLKGKSLLMPSGIVEQQTPRILRESSKKVLADITRADGWEIDASTCNANFREALMYPTDLNTDDVGHFKLASHENGSHNVLPSISDSKFEGAVVAFNRITSPMSNPSSWSFVVTTVLRDRASQIIDKVDPNTDIHCTGLAVEVSTGRFIDPDGHEITWSKNPEMRSKIEKELQPQLLEAFVSSDAIVRLDKGGYLDAYFPIDHVMEIGYYIESAQTMP